MMEKLNVIGQFGISRDTAEQQIRPSCDPALQSNGKSGCVGRGERYNYRCFYIGFPQADLVYFTPSFKGLSLTSAVIDLFCGKQTSWALKWVGYEPESSSLSQDFKNKLARRGFEFCFRLIEENKLNNPAFTIGERDLNQFGYSLLEDGNVKGALEVFKLNVKLNPSSWNTHDSLAETCEIAGDAGEAIGYYKSSLTLNPRNNHAVQRLSILQPGLASEATKEQSIFSSELVA